MSASLTSCLLDHCGESRQSSVEPHPSPWSVRPLIRLLYPERSGPRKGVNAAAENPRDPPVAGAGHKGPAIGYHRSPPSLPRAELHLPLQIRAAVNVGSPCAERHGRGRRKAYNCLVLVQNDQHDVEVAMKYVLLGNLSPEWANKQSERIGKAKAKLDKLGIKIDSIHYTQGYYDFIDIVDAPKPEAMLAFSVWYSAQGLGRIQSMPAFDAKSFETAIKDAAG
jgi:uncharacterized protein with GYD domain